MCEEFFVSAVVGDKRLYMDKSSCGLTYRKHNNCLN
jgi:hypothetical protein